MSSSMFTSMYHAFNESFIDSLHGSVNSISVNANGVSYSNTDTITFIRNPSDSVLANDAVAIINTDSVGAISNAVIVSGGDYSYPPTVVVTTSTGGGASLSTTVDCDNYYLMLSGTSPYNNEPTPDDISTSYLGSQQIPYSESVFGSKLSLNSFSSMITVHAWTANTVFAQYDDTDPDLESKAFYCSTSSGDVFKCIQNGGGVPSTVQPANTAPTAFPEIESDGYQWFYLYSIRNNPPFSTVYNNLNWMPVMTNPDVAAATQRGSILNVVVTDVGSGYPTSTGVVNVGTSDPKAVFLSGVPSVIPNYYSGCTLTVWEGSTPTNFVVNTSTTSGDGQLQVNLTSNYTANVGVVYQLAPSIQISGDGTGFVGHAIVSGNNQNITQIVVTNPGMNYSYANAQLVNLNSFGSNASIRAVVSPGAGHGSNVEDELFSQNIGIVSAFSAVDPKLSTNTINATITFRTLAIIRNPLAYSALTFGSNTLYTDPAVNQRVILSVSGSGSFIAGEKAVTGGKVVMVVAAVNNASEIEVTGLSSIPVVGDTLSGLQSGAMFTINSIGIGGVEASPDLQLNSGEVVYLNNIVPTIYDSNALPPVIRIVLKP